MNAPDVQTISSAVKAKPPSKADLGEARLSLVHRGKAEVLKDYAALNIEWDYYPRVPAGTYYGYCIMASQPYWCRAYKRWQVVLKFQIFSPGKLEPIATLAKFMSLGKRKKPHAARTGKYFTEWIRANGGPPARGDRMSPRIFETRMATVKVEDTSPKLSPAPYSVVREIVSWESAAAPRDQRISKSTNQPRHNKRAAK